MKTINWESDDWYKAVPKRALVDALRNCSIGPSNLSAQDKKELVRLANQYMPVKGDYLKEMIEREVFFRKHGYDKGEKK